MKPSLTSLMEGVRPVPKKIGNGTRYVADCPLCPYTHAVDVLGSADAARAAATQNIRTHLLTVHAAEITLAP